MYEYDEAGSTWDGSGRVYAAVLERLAGLPPGARVLDAGCGNGHFTSLLAARGFVSHGIDPSETGIAIARQAYPEATFACADLANGLDAPTPFDAIVCVEVIEHVYSPQRLLATLFSVLKPRGVLILTTPYHGYLKNVAIAASGRFDQHVNPLWEHGHIKFFSPSTLSEALEGAGFSEISIRGIGRLAYLWKSMVATARKPA